jgi:hypothetical protein
MNREWPEEGTQTARYPNIIVDTKWTPSEDVEDVDGDGEYSAYWTIVVTWQQAENDGSG